MMTVAKGVLKAKMLEYFRRIEKTGEELIVTDSNRPVLRVIPLTKKRRPDEVFGPFRGRLRYQGELTEGTEAEWPEL